jgi:hypothetical protein
MKFKKEDLDVFMRTLDSLIDYYKDLNDEFYKGKADAFRFVRVISEEIFETRERDDDTL